MSEDLRDLYYHHPFQDDRHGGFNMSASFPYGHHLASSSMAGSHSVLHTSHMLDPSYMSFTDCLLQGPSDQNSLARAFGLSPPSSSETFSLGVNKDDRKSAVAAEARDHRSETPVTPNSSISSSSTEAVGDEDSNKGKKEKQMKETTEEDDQSPKKE